MDYFEEETGLSKWCWFCCVFVGPCRVAVSVRRIAEVVDLSSAIDERRFNLGVVYWVQQRDGGVVQG